MINAIIVDDEARGRQTLVNLLKVSCPEVEVLAQCDSVASALIAIPKQMLDLVFLDVEMPEQNGFALLEQLPEINFDVIFTTAHSHHAIKAIKFSAVDYLLKPIDMDELRTAIQRVDPKRHHKPNKNIEFLLQNNRESAQKLDKVALPTNDGFVFIEVKHIIRCEASGSYTIFYFDDRDSIVVCKNLGEYEDLFGDHNFFRVHHSHIINLEHMLKYTRGDGGYVDMKDGSTIEVSRRKKEGFLQKLMKG